MYGDGVGSLSILRKFDNSVLSDTLWKKSGDQDNIWRMGRVNLEKTNVANNFTLYFEGVKGKSVRGKIFNKNFYKCLCKYSSSNIGDIAIDDVLIKKETCGPTFFCDFEEDLCSWSNAQNGYDDDFDWLRNSGSTATFATGPSVDVYIFFYLKCFFY